MAKIFTITEGVENMGALKTGGQGSVYKGKRIGEIITAIKILPTPIYSESGDDKNFLSFQNEVQKLKKVNEDPNANVVSILNSGITESGNFPFIEMEYIEGPDLAELLKPPHEAIFTIAEVLKVAMQLSNALAHCHRVDVKHGDIKSNNVKFNTQTGNYILLDFGLSVMSDEERRSSLRQAGAVEFMAPEQHKGEMLFETEVYSFGIILFELLAGVVPFHLKDNTESSRNAVIIAQLESLPPSLLSLRQQHLPEHWSDEKKALEMNVPEWLVSMVYRCLNKDPLKRFADGVVLHEHIVNHSISAAGQGQYDWGAERIAKLEQENEKLVKEKNELQDKVNTFEKYNDMMGQSSTASVNNNKKAPASKLFTTLMVVAMLVAVATAAFFFMKWRSGEEQKRNERLAAEAARQSGDQPGEEQAFQLKKAKNLLSSGRIEEARQLYKTLAAQDIPEAMFEYANLTLLNNTNKSECPEAINYLKRATVRNYPAAKRTLGLLYVLSNDTTALQQKGYHGCPLVFDIKRGSRLLVEASMQGDSTASALMDEFNTKFGR